MYQVPGREVFQFLERNKHRWHVVRDRSWIIGYLISNQTAGTLAVILNNRRVTVREAAFLALGAAAAYIPGGLTWPRYLTPQETGIPSPA
jgi:hypothetical protein